MKRFFLAVLMMLPASLMAANSDEQLFGVAIGSQLPSHLRKGPVDMGHLMWAQVPVLDPVAKEIIHQGNLFLDAKTFIVAGFRADRVMQSLEECQKMEAQLEARLSVLYPVPYQTNDWRFSKHTHKAKNGPVIASALCERKAPFNSLVLEVTDPGLEEALMDKRSGNQR